MSGRSRSGKTGFTAEYAEFGVFLTKPSLGVLSASAVKVPNPTWNELYRAGK